MKRTFRLFSHLLIGLLVCSFIGLFRAPSAHASEGTAWLSGPDTAAQCFAASVLVGEEDYRLVLTCRDLIVPPGSETLFYHAWIKRSGVAESQESGLAGLRQGAFVSLGDITGGKLSAKIREPFDKILITVETMTRPSNPDLKQIIISGLVNPIDFTAGKLTLPTDTLFQVTLEPTSLLTPPPEPRRSAAAAAFRVFLSVLGVIIIIAVVISILQRRSAAK